MPSYKLKPPLMRGPGPILAGDPAERGVDQILIGRKVEGGPIREIWLDASGEQVIAVFGKRGTGKSYSLGVLIEGLSAGQGDSRIARLNTPRGGLVFDIMDIFWTSRIPLSDGGSPEIRKQHKIMRDRNFSALNLNIDVWIPSGFENSAIDPQGIHCLKISPSDLSLDDWGALFGVDVYSEPRGMLIADLIQHVSSAGYTNEEGEFVQPEANFSLPDLLACLQDDPEILNNYNDATRRSVRQRLTSYRSLPLFQGPGTSIGNLIQAFRVTILMLGRVPDALKSVIVAVLLRKIMRVRRDVSFATKRLDLDESLSQTERQRLGEFISNGLPRTWVFVDEAHNIVGTGENTVASDAIIKYAKEGRNYGLSLAVATQQPGVLDQKLLSQVETLITHQLTSPYDIGIAEKSMRSPAPDELKIDGVNATMEELFRRLGQGEAVFSCGNAPSLPRCCVIGVRPRISAHGGYEA